MNDGRIYGPNCDDQVVKILIKACEMRFDTNQFTRYKLHKGVSKNNMKMFYAQTNEDVLSSGKHKTRCMLIELHVGFIRHRKQIALHVKLPVAMYHRTITE